MVLHPLTFVVLGLACFRLTHLIVVEEITTFLRTPFVDAVNERDARGRWIKLQYPKPHRIRGFIGALLSCPWCTGIWVGIALVMGWYTVPHVVFPVALIFAVSGLGVIAEMATQYWNRNSFSPTPEQIARINAINALLEYGTATRSPAEANKDSVR
ncbi:hypothetical protein TPY_2083 [Sulfobacillus acidophilus TPY]|uniref:DUF1360 domain-containing protein n=1 Tax=Sulfobacillus acidophilus (strain ATCC 700253 / DSM 10332 / NAL) TaxID=679936 RepID=G8TZV7_SULAD|nr:hypothetical protein TPY_2083 [Sulfobacillus acidophilus TPY]AEW04126.1 protein of unknown function DUF1360 [Sulfobacillus acidophilus DSM 10332]